MASDLPVPPDESTPGFVRRHLVLVSGATIAGLAVLAWLAFGYFGVQTLWIDDVADDAGPVFDSGATADAVPADAVPADPTPADPGTGTGPTGTTAAPAPVVETVASGRFISRDHPTEGTAAVLTDGSAQRFLRFTEFATDNGPDLNVYLSTGSPDGDAGAFDDDFVDLGDLRGNVGDQNYEIPSDVDLSRYRSVVVWCVRFSVPFGAAPLNPA